MTTTIDTTAPVIASASIRVAADPETVWGIISDIEAWPSWNPDVTSAELHGTLARGTEFTWKAGPGTIRSTLLQVDARRFIAWTGKTMGITAVHVWKITPSGDGVELSTEESWRGLLPRLARPVMRKSLERAIKAGLAAAKAEAETRL